MSLNLVHYYVAYKESSTGRLVQQLKASHSARLSKDKDMVPFVHITVVIYWHLLGYKKPQKTLKAIIL